VLAGDGENEEELRAKLSELGIADLAAAPFA